MNASSDTKKKPATLSFATRRKDSTPHMLMDRLVKAHHPHLKHARIEIFWKAEWRADPDTGRIRLWKVVKPNELFREYAEKAAGESLDMIVVLNEERWHKATCDEEAMLFILDSALSEIKPDLDREGEQRIDEENRLQWRKVKPPIETSPEIVERYGFYDDHLHRLMEIAHKSDLDDRPLLAMLEDTAATVGGDEEDDDETDETVDEESHAGEPAVV